MNILITGVAGFIGSHLAEVLVYRGDYVIGVDNFETGKLQNLRFVTGRKNFYLSNVDISGYEPLKIVFGLAPWDVVIHCAASYKNPANWKRDIEVNCIGTANLLKLCGSSSVKRLIYFQTSLCYGTNPICLDPWEKDAPLSINTMINPAPNSYAITKTTAEKLIAMSEVPYLSFRLANCYGPRNLSGPIPIFFKNIVTGRMSLISLTRRDFVFIEDLVRLVIRAVDGEGVYNYYHISTGFDYEIMEIHKAMLEILGDDKYPGSSIIGKMVDRKPEDAYTILLNPAETYKDFPGWKAEVDMRTGLIKAINWYKENGVGETYTHLDQFKKE